MRHAALATGVLATLLASSATVASASVLQRVQAERMAQLGTELALTQGDHWWAHQLLVDPASAYSETIDQPRFTNEIWWQAVLDGTHGESDEGDLLHQLRRELGMTRARPGVDITPGIGFRDPLVAANAAKAGLDADIFWHVLDMFGHAGAHRFASQTIGMQLLRESMAATPPDRQLTVGIYADVFRRVMAASHPSQLTAHDLRYLDTLVQHRLLHPGRETDLPVAWRIARVAAAFRDTQGYIGGPPCHPDATPHHRYAGTGRAGDQRVPCLVAATDRAVQGWYVDDMRQPNPTPPAGHHGLGGVALLLGALLPLLDMAALVEVVEASLADDMVAADAMSATDADELSERAARLTCRIPE